MADHSEAMTLSNLSMTSSSVTNSPTHSLISQLAIICMFAVLSVVGIFGNSFSIFLLTGKRCSRNRGILSPAYRVYIIALAVADNGMLFFTGILRYTVVDLMYETNQSSWFYTVYLCRWHRLLMHMSHNAAVWLLVVMAVDRFIAVSFPFKYREIKHDSSKAVKVTITVFLLSFLFATPYLAVGPIHQQNQTSVPRSNVFNVSGINSADPNLREFVSIPVTSLEFPTNFLLNDKNLHSAEENLDSVIIGCSLTATFDERWAYAISIGFHVLLAFLIPYFVLLVLSIFTLRCLHYQSKGRPKRSTASWRQNMNRKITIMMLVVCFTFIILWLPQALLLMTKSDAHSHNLNKNEVGNSLAALSGLLNSALNFVLYCLTVRKFRKRAWVNLKRLCCCFTKRTSLSTESIGRAMLSSRFTRRKRASLTSSKSDFQLCPDRSSTTFREPQNLSFFKDKTNNNPTDSSGIPQEQISFMLDVKQDSSGYSTSANEKNSLTN